MKYFLWVKQQRCAGCGKDLDLFPGCLIAGNARHSGIGSDLDGAFGREQTPTDLETIADLGRIPALLAARGFQTADVELIVHGNFIRFLRDTWK